MLDEPRAVGFPSRLRRALLAAPLLILGAGVIRFYLNSPPFSFGANITSKAIMLGAIAASISALLGAYRLIFFPASRNGEAFILTGMNGLVLGASMAYLYFMLTRPPSGFIEVRYDRMSATGVFWLLQNRSTQSIYIRGSDGRAWPGYARTTCRTMDFSSEQSDPPELADGFYSAMKVLPDAEIRLDVPTALPVQFKGGHCRLRLTLEGGTFIESDEFQPE